MDPIDLQMPFHGDAAKALDVVATMLSSDGFRITSRAAYELELAGPPTPIGYHEMSRFWGASTINVSQKGGALRLKAAMDGFNRGNVVAAQLVLGIMALLAAALFSIVSVNDGLAGLLSLEAVMLVAGLPLLIAGVIWLAVRQANTWHEKRIKRSFETLLNKAVILAQQV